MGKYFILPPAPTTCSWQWLRKMQMTQCIQNYIQCGTKEMYDGFLDLFLPVLLKNMICKCWSDCDKMRHEETQLGSAAVEEFPLSVV